MIFKDELKEQARELYEKIVFIFENNSVEVTADNIIKYCAEAVIKMYHEQNISVQSLLEIILACREHLVYDSSIHKLISLVAEDHANMAASVSKVCLNNSAEIDTSRFCELLTKYKHNKSINAVIRRFYSEEKEEEIVTYSECVSSLNDAVHNASKDNKLVLNLLNSSPNVPSEILNTLIQVIEPQGNENLQILHSIFEHNKRNISIFKCASQRNKSTLETSNTTVEMQMSPELISLVRYEVVEASHDEKQLEEFVSVFSDYLLPYFMSMISNLNKEFLETGKHAVLLRNIAKYINTEEFLEIIHPLDIQKHWAVLRDASNQDLSTFVGLYNKFYKTPGDLKAVMACLPGFVSYCSDSENNIHRIIEIFKQHINLEKNIVMRALERIIYSHELNLKDNLVLRNPVPKEDSFRILEAIRNSGLIFEVMKAFIASTNNECDEAFELLVGITGLDMSAELESIIMNPSQNSSISLCDAIRLMGFFIGKWNYSYDLVSEMLQHCRNPDVNICKKSYYLLYFMAKNSKLPCICDLLFTSSESLQNTAVSRNRMMLLFTILLQGCKECKCCDMPERFFRELVVYSLNGNIKCKKYLREIVLEIGLSPVLRNYLISLINAHVDEIQIVKGCIEVASLIFEQIGNSMEKSENDSNTVECLTKQQDEQREFARVLFSRIIETSCSSEQYVKQVIGLFRIILSSGVFEEFYEDISCVMEKYSTQFNKKYNREIKECAALMGKNNITLVKGIKNFTRFKNKGGHYKKIQVVKHKDANAY
ncbi:hypothetical protein ENBRE01_1044 [Enteropsectra breve]|nr:hypothetical protein ENBRE01_1044 [Enteropsectra breve]